MSITVAQLGELKGLHLPHPSHVESLTQNWKRFNMFRTWPVSKGGGGGGGLVGGSRAI